MSRIKFNAQRKSATDSESKRIGRTKIQIQRQRNSKKLAIRRKSQPDRQKENETKEEEPDQS